MGHDLEVIATQIVNAAYQLHRDLGPGLLESVYEIILCDQLEKAGFQVSRQVKVPIVYQGITFDEAFRADIVVEGKIVIELKSVELLAPVHAKQLLTYLRLMNLRLGFLINFGSRKFKDGIHRIINGYE